ncbi:hypothetical protein LT330_003635 [Penicillium expansum]|uniref:Amidase domain-containing protein n=1 Tax=Penicillium expansum TaxID=27334 RepID=A0A0A2JD99_PENEN|nr:hypothetical protein PEX2_060090 [Penicillium expansum]KAK4861600.1 hypothetical protein LT330_003635 [Penicillium expansum]KGO46746.1 hypothetical protein PEXP_069160 [Penicillium expansum]KGO53402.1 hypothetical protein PEX2_060090 [Penicillium expansum]
MADNDQDLSKILEMEATRSSAIAYEGHSRDDRNFAGHKLVVVSAEVMYSFNQTDIIDHEDLSGHRIRIWVRAGARGFRIARTTTGAGSVLRDGPAVPFDVGMEIMAPPTPVEVPGMPAAAIVAPRAASLETETRRAFATPTMSAIAAYWHRSCAGGDSYQGTNCAHFLSDTFIRAGFTELNPPNPHINARCPTTARRPVRARDMWSWFQSKARVTSRTAQRNTGWWAVFQLDESYYGGHVAVLDSDAWVYYGTAWYATWDQYLYKW